MNKIATPTLVIDARMLGKIPHGIARYVKNLALGLDSLGSLPYEPIFLVSDEGRGQIPSSFKTIHVKAPFLSAREMIEIPLRLKSIKPALYHSLSFSSLIYSPCPWMITLHDLNHLHFGGLREKIYYRAIMKPFARGARRVTTVSEFSRAEIAAWIGRPPSSIEIIYNALDPIFFETSNSGNSGKSEKSSEEILQKHRLQTRNYFIFLSHHSKAHKNSPFLLAAYQEAKRRNPSLPPLAINSEKTELPSGRRKSGVLSLGKLPDSELKVLIENARAVLFPSIYEGFGLPPLEAAILGARVLVSDIPSHREALVDFSPPQIQWLDPRDSEAWTQALMDINNRESARPVPEQLARAKARFSPQALAEHMDRIYRNVLGC